ncbi:hypothetical protein [Hymenobacter rubripertinctus]|uniref:Uncharacterized protein n=1 Tax=Hymenobacter rubripertinctus TaxID=2029981 RepID=A0A418QR37_9BACT|nr:hypothetical protein [Hymenobacter rubripertinctus]RIY07739.1 hypothetical protein D0T11_15925 [Hymenobacter rubripertinctus]
MPDSDPRPNADEDWDTLLRHWRNQPAAQPRPYFYNRVRARLDRETAVTRLLVPAWLRWPAYAVMLGALLLLSGDDAAQHSVSSASQNRPDRIEFQPAGD